MASSAESVIALSFSSLSLSVSSIFFGAKETYKLYNYTADPTETSYATYNATARTAKIAGFAHQVGLFQYQIGLLKFLPLVVVNMYPQLYDRAKETIANMSRANYFYIIAYPTYSGYRVVHDPTLTVYLTESASLIPPNLGGLLIVGGIAAAVIVAAALVMRWRKPKQTETLQPPTS